MSPNRSTTRGFRSRYAGSILLPSERFQNIETLSTDGSAAPGRIDVPKPRRPREPWYVGILIATITTLIFSAFGTAVSGVQIDVFVFFVLLLGILSLFFLAGYYLRHWIIWGLGIGICAIGGMLVLATINTDYDGWESLFAVLLAIFIIVPGACVITGAIAGKVAAHIWNAEVPTEIRRFLYVK